MNYYHTIDEWNEECKNGNVDIIRDFIKNRYPYDIVNGCAIACEYNLPKEDGTDTNYELVKLFTEIFSIRDMQDDINDALSVSAEHGCIQTAIYILTLEPTDLNTALCSASYNCHIHMVNLLISHGATDFLGAIENASMGGAGDIILVRILLDKLFEFRRAKRYAIQTGKHQIAELLDDYRRRLGRDV